MRILICSDGSKWAQKSARFALQLFRDTTHELTVLVFKLRPNKMDSTPEKITRGTIDKQDNIGAGRSPKTIERRVEGLVDGLDVEHDEIDWLYEQGDMAAHVLTIASDYDLVCVGGAGKGGFSQKMLGLVADTIVKEGKGNLMVTKTSDVVCRRVLVALTPASIDGRMAHYLGSMFKETPASITIEVLWEELPGRFEGYMEGTTGERVKRMVKDNLVKKPGKLEEFAETIESYGVPTAISYQDYESLNLLIEDVSADAYDLLVVHPPEPEETILTRLEPEKQALTLMRKSSPNVLLLRNLDVLDNPYDPEQG